MQGLAAAARTHHLILFHAALPGGAIADRRRGGDRGGGQARLAWLWPNQGTMCSAVRRDGSTGMRMVKAARRQPVVADGEHGLVRCAGCLLRGCAAAAAGGEHGGRARGRHGVGLTAREPRRAGICRRAEAWGMAALTMARHGSWEKQRAWAWA